MITNISRFDPSSASIEVDIPQIEQVEFLQVELYNSTSMNPNLDLLVSKILFSSIVAAVAM